MPKVYMMSTVFRCLVQSDDEIVYVRIVRLSLGI